ncbi:hypothetical protein GCM10023094_01840 [Rhodococcus olei]|uniref:Secreted protein n=1 Tax=Rhodococcus olei TaxID=2161675 RepID=A0ABP8NUI4_9NOCA
MRQSLTTRRTRRRLGLAAVGVAALALATPAVAAADPGSSDPAPVTAANRAAVAPGCTGPVILSPDDLQRLIGEGRVVPATPTVPAELIVTRDDAPAGLTPVAALPTAAPLDGPALPFPPAPADAGPVVVLAQAPGC